MGATAKHFGGSTIDSTKEEKIPKPAHTLCCGSSRQRTFKDFVEPDCKKIDQRML